MKNKWFTVLLALICLILAVEPALGQDLETVAASAILMDANSGMILFEKDPDTPRPPASMTKIMTLLLALEAVDSGRVSLDDKVHISEKTREIEGTQVWLEPGERWPLEDLLIAIAVASANDACIAVAEHVSGTEQKFVSLMNQKARELGMRNTNFINTHGLPGENHYMSAGDVARLSKEAIRVPKLLELTSIYEYPQFRSEPRLLNLWNTNKLLVWYDGVDGLKTGWTEEAGFCLAATAKRDGLRLISIVMDCPIANGHFSETIRLFQYGFANFISERSVSRGQILGLLPVKRGREKEVGVMAATDLYLTLPKGENKVEIRVSLDVEGLDAPVEAGKKCGVVELWRESMVVGKGDIVTAASIARSNILLNSWQLWKKWYHFAGKP